jgi:hypothetical protein
MQYVQFNYYPKPWDKMRKGGGTSSPPPPAADSPAAASSSSKGGKVTAAAGSQGNIERLQSFSYDTATLDHPACECDPTTPQPGPVAAAAR